MLILRHYKIEQLKGQQSTVKILYQLVKKEKYI